MNGKQKGVLLGVGLLLLLLIGAGAYAVLRAPKSVQTTPAPPAPTAEAFVLGEEPRLRVFCGELQWYDGALWKTLCDFEAFCGEDPFLVESVSDGTAPEEGGTVSELLYHNRAQGDVPRKGGGGGGGSSGGGEWSGDYE